MPGIPLSAREATHSGTADQMCHPDAQVHLSTEDELADEEGLSIYCKPVELYNILQRRAVRNPLFLQRCLHYKKEAKHCKRLQMKICLSGLSNQRLQIQALFPLHIMLAKRDPNINETEYPAVFRFTSIRALTSSSTMERNSVLASFILPEINRLGKEAKSGLYFILFISYAESNSSCESNISKDSSESISYSSKAEKYCCWGRIPLESLFISLEKSLRLSLGERAEIILNLDLSPTLLKSGCFDNDNYISFQPPLGSADMRTLKQVQVIISAEELGAKERSPYNSFTYSSIRVSSMPSTHVLRLRSGNVVFNYRYNGNRSQRTEVTEDFICPLCLLGCASFKGLRYHLCSSHDLLNYEFWETEECQVVNVSVITAAWKFEMVGDADPQRQTFHFCKRPRIRRRGTSLSHCAKHAFPLAFASNMPAGVSELSDKADDAQSSKDDMARSLSVDGSQNVIADTGCLYAELGENIAPPVMLQFAKTRKISFERSEYRNRALLEKRQFFHSHRAQPMPLEQVLSDRDSEDEVDDDVADLEDRRMLDDFIDVSKDEKHMMHLWNSFVRKQRVLADSHIPWACEAFSRLHGPELTRLPAIGWCWRIFMIKLWNHGLLDARSMNNCNVILDQFVNL